MSAEPVFVIRIPGRRMFMRWEGERTVTGFVDYSDGTGGVATTTMPEGPAFGRLVTYTRAEAEAVLARARASGSMAKLVAECVIEPHVPEAGA